MGSSVAATAWVLCATVLAAPAALADASPLRSDVDPFDRAAVVEGFSATFDRFYGATRQTTAADLDICLPGRAADLDIQRYVAMWNFQRNLAGLDNLEPVLDGRVADGVHEAAMVMAANNALSHVPRADGFRCVTDSADAAAQRSNLGLGFERTPLGASVLSFTDDAGQSNDVVGHRIGLLNPYLTRGAVGLAREGSSAVQMYSLSDSAWDEALQAAGGTTPEFITWPSAGYFPAPLFPATEKEK